MIKLENVKKVFRTEEIETWALREVNLEVKEGEFVAIMGLRVAESPHCSTYWDFWTIRQRAHTCSTARM